MQPPSKAARPIPVARRSVHDSVSKSEMGRSLILDNSHDMDESSRPPSSHAMSNARAKAMMTPEQERRRYNMMSSPSPAMYAGHQPPKSSPTVRPQSAMALTSPHGSSNYINNINYNNNSNYGKTQHARPPSSLGLAWNSGMRDVKRNQPEKVVMHQHSRSYGDGVTSENIYTDGVLPGHFQNDVYSASQPTPHQDQKRNPAFERNLHKSPQTSRMHPNGPRGSYNPYYASNLDLNSRPDAQKDRVVPDNPPHLRDVPVSGTGAMPKSATPAHASQDLRSAWQRLYGQGHGGESHSRRPSMDHIGQTSPLDRTDDSSFNISPRQDSRSPQLSGDNMHSPSPQSFSRGKQVAGPMVTPFSNTGRQSPPGQCASNQNEPPPVMNISNEPRSFSSPRTALKSTYRPPPPSHDAHSLGPAAKYPEPDMGLRKPSNKYGESPTPYEMNNFGKTKEQPSPSGRWTPKKPHHKDLNESREESGLHHHFASRSTHNYAFRSDSENETEEDANILPTDSIFDYAESQSEEDADSVIHLSKTLKGSQQVLDPSLQMGEKDHNVMHLREAAKPSERRQDMKTTHYARSRSLEDVRESGDDSNVSFDIENTILMVEPSDQSEMGTLKSKNSDVKTKLNRLEGMYAKVMKTLETRNPKESRTRRWSIGSSDTNSLRHQVHHSTKHGRSAAQRTGNREIKSINKRFQRLESHVITLARSIAHISSELRTQTTMTREIENVKREIQDLKVSSKGNGGNERKRQDFDKYRGYNHPLNNPRQVNKLTRFFGQEPSWLEIFMTRLGYGQYVKNFDQEHIGMMELPYMTDDQLKSIGIPMGPRTRILQESQMCFKDDNFNIYIV